jgi:hypothetical protein
MSISKAKKVGKRTWSYEKFQAAVAARAKRAGVSLKSKATLIKQCYEERVTVADTVALVSEGGAS